MAMLDYGAILKINGVLQNLNKGLFMDMEEAVGFVIEKIEYQYTYNGKTINAFEQINGNYFTYFGDEELLFATYKDMLCVVTNKTEVNHIYFSMKETKGKHVIRKIFPNGAILTVKRIAGSQKLHAKLQYKGNNYEVIYGYGIDNNLNMYKKLRKIQYGHYSFEHSDYINRPRKDGYRYGYNAKIVRHIDKFLK